MEIDIDVRANRIVVQCSGRLDATGGPLLERRVMPFLEPKEGVSLSPVNLDLSQVEYLSSAGIRSLIILAKTARALAALPGSSGAVLRVTQPSLPVVQVLTLVGMLDDLMGLSRPAPDAAQPQTGTDYRKLMETIRQAFPAPVSDAMKDGYFVHTISKGLDRLDALKTQRPYLGERVPLDYEEARKTVMPETTGKIETTVDDMAHYMEGLTIWGHAKTQVNVAPPPSIPSIIGQLFASIYNPNIIWDEASHRLAQAEVEVASMCAALIGYDPAKAVGISTFGGTGTVFYGVKIGAEKAQPGAFMDGIRHDIKVVSSEVGHYAKYSALGWLGIGMKNLVSVPTDEDNAMGLEELETALRGLLDAGGRIACIIATMGTTDAFGVDNLEYIVRLRDRLVQEYSLSYVPHVHADAVIGWAWSVFNDYDFAGNPMKFPPRTLRSLWDAHMGMKSLALADSVGIDFHKTGYAPYISSLFLCKDRADLDLITRDKALMPYIFQWGNYHPGVFTMETSRSGGSVLAAWANLKFFGKEGYRALLGHIVTIAESLRSRLERAPYAVPVNDYNYGPVTLFRVYPEGVDAKTAYRTEASAPDSRDRLLEHNEYNRKLFDVLHKQMEAGEGLALSITERYRTAANGAPILAIKSFVMSPFADEDAMDRLMQCIEQARKEIA